MEKNNITKNLLKWFYKNQRSMPWRETNLFYNIWLSEVMLQQTQVKTVIPYYNKWINIFPTIESVSNAEEDKILKYWEGLGYYARVRNFKKACEYIHQKNINIKEINFDDFLKLPGVGIYTASAVFSIVKNQIYPVIDGNVKRVLSRVLRLNKKPDFYFKKMNKYLSKIISKKNPGDFNQAIMELGATICKPKKIYCSICPINQHCKGYIKNDYFKFPIKAKKKIKPHYYVSAGIIWKNDYIIISKRKSEGMLGGLWEIPGGKVKKNETNKECLKREIMEEINIEVDILNYLGQIKHQYSHFSITLNAYECTYISGDIKALECSDIKQIKLNEISKFPFPKANHKIFKLLEKKYYN